MKKTEIVFTTAEKRSLRYPEGEVFHQAYLVHNRVLSEEATRQAFADYAELKRVRSDWAIDALCGFIAEQVAQGNRLDFGGFSVALTIRGGVKGANAVFDATQNKINVAMTPGKAMLKAAAALKPVNSRTVEARIISTDQESPEVGGHDVLSEEGERRVRTVFNSGIVRFVGDDSGFWVESDGGEKLCVGTDLSGEAPLCRYTLSGYIPKGEHWLVAAGRIGGADGEYVRLVRRITVR